MRYKWSTTNDMNIIQPLVIPGDRVFISSELGNGFAMLQVSKNGPAWAVEQAWANRKLAAKFANPVVHGQNIYGLHYGRLSCLDVWTGDLIWRGPDFQHGQVLLTGDVLIVTTERTGQLVTVAADPTKYRELGRTNFTRIKKTWNTHALAGKQLFVRNHAEMACLDLAD